MAKVFCPKCGNYHEAQPVKVTLGEQHDSDWEELSDFNPQGEGEDTVVTIEGAHIEAGPYNGEDYLYEPSMYLCECPECGNEFCTEEHAEEKLKFSVVGIYESTGQIVCDEVEASDAMAALGKAIKDRSDLDYKAVAAIQSNSEDLAFNDEAWNNDACGTEDWGTGT